MKTITVDKKELIGVLQDVLSEIISVEMVLEREYGIGRSFEEIVEQGYAPDGYHILKNYLEKIKEQ